MDIHLPCRCVPEKSVIDGGIGEFDNHENDTRGISD